MLKKLSEENGNLDLQGDFLAELTRLEIQTSGSKLLDDYYRKMKQVEDSLNMQ
nr:hypothetical protein [Bacteroidota bacterium]